jgi:hypothetical protein
MRNRRIRAVRPISSGQRQVTTCLTQAEVAAVMTKRGYRMTKQAVHATEKRALRKLAYRLADVASEWMQPRDGGSEKSRA